MSKPINIVGGGLSTEADSTLTILLDQIIPSDPHRGKPSAADVNVVAYIQERDPEMMKDIEEEMDELSEQAKSTYSDELQNLSPEQQTDVINQAREKEPRFYTRLAVHTVTAYYQNEQVLNSIGLQARAPYPKGYTVRKGDLSLLEPVRQRGPIWRKTD